MSLIHIPGFVNRVQPHVLPGSQVNTEPSSLIKTEPPDYEIMESGMDDIFDSSESEETIPDIKNIDIVWHPLYKDSIKCETDPEDILKSKHLEFVETEVLVKAENSPFIKTENLTESKNLNKAKDITDGQVNRGTGQEVVKVQGTNEYVKSIGNVETNKQLVLNFSKDLNSINIRSRKAKHSKTDFAESYKTTSRKNDKEKIKVIEAPVIPVEPHEFTSLTKDVHVCNHCQSAFSRLYSLKFHIKKMHREVTTMYLCPYCPYKSKWGVTQHIIQKHKDTRDVQWFQCYLCQKKFKFKFILTQHIKMVHLKLDQMQDTLEICQVCGKGFKTRHNGRNLVKVFYNKIERNCEKCKYLKPESQLLKQDIIYKKYKRYFCEKCAFVSRHLTKFKLHELSHKPKAEMDDEDLKYRCDKCSYKTYRLDSFKRHKLNHLKPEESQYFYCYHCSYKSNQKENLKRHIFKYFINGKFIHHTKCNETEYMNQHKKRYRCDQCDFNTHQNQNLKKHKLTHLKPEEIQYFYCNHCSYKCRRKDYLMPHIFRHFKREEIKFHCYLCEFVTLKRELIIEHIKKHLKVQIKTEVNE